MTLQEPPGHRKPRIFSLAFRKKLSTCQEDVHFTASSSSPKEAHQRKMFVNTTTSLRVLSLNAWNNLKWSNTTGFKCLSDDSMYRPYMGKIRLHRPVQTLSYLSALKQLHLPRSESTRNSYHILKIRILKFTSFIHGAEAFPLVTNIFSSNKRDDTGKTFDLSRSRLCVSKSPTSFTSTAF